MQFPRTRHTLQRITRHQDRQRPDPYHDAHDTVVSSVTIRRGLFAAPDNAQDPCMQVIDVHGRTVVPGLIDNHNHIVLLSERPRPRYAPGIRHQYRRGTGRPACTQPHP